MVIPKVRYDPSSLTTNSTTLTNHPTNSPKPISEVGPVQATNMTLGSPPGANTSNFMETLTRLLYGRIQRAIATFILVALILVIMNPNFVKSTSSGLGNRPNFVSVSIAGMLAGLIVYLYPIENYAGPW